MKSSVRGVTVKSKHKRRNLFEILNTAIRQHAGMIVLPELAIPIEWLPLLVQQSCRHNIGIVTGLDFHQCNDVIYNKIAVILPIKAAYFTTALIKLRTKNYYSPGEEEFIKGNFRKLPYGDTRIYDLYHWKGVYFSVYNCFELSNISDRSIFKSKVDFIIATEFNTDIPYFANIAESWARDLHCFIIQVNSSHFGDSRIVQPSKSETRDILFVKGGRYPLLLIDSLNIDGIRDFQLHAYNWQLTEGKSKFKPTPPRFSPHNTELRINNESAENLMDKSEQKDDKTDSTK